VLIPEAPGVNEEDTAAVNPDLQQNGDDNGPTLKLVNNVDMLN